MDIEVIQEQIDVLINRPRKPLTKWERDFLESIADQFERRKFLTPSQTEKLDQIYNDKA